MIAAENTIATVSVFSGVVIALFALSIFNLIYSLTAPCNCNLQPVYARLTLLESSLTNISNDVNTLGTQIEFLEQEIVNVSTKVDTFDNVTQEVQMLSMQVESLTQEVANVSAQVQTFDNVTQQVTEDLILINEILQNFTETRDFVLQQLIIINETLEYFSVIEQQVVSQLAAINETLEAFAIIEQQVLNELAIINETLEYFSVVEAQVIAELILINETFEAYVTNRALCSTYYNVSRTGGVLNPFTVNIPLQDTYYPIEVGYPEYTVNCFNNGSQIILEKAGWYILHLVVSLDSAGGQSRQLQAAFTVNGTPVETAEGVIVFDSLSGNAYISVTLADMQLLNIGDSIGFAVGNFENAANIEIAQYYLFVLQLWPPQGIPGNFTMPNLNTASQINSYGFT